MKFHNQVLSLHSDALPPDTLMVQKLSGEERVSGLFRFELDLICEDAELDLETVLYAPAKLGIKVSVRMAGGKVGTATREVAGVFEEFEQHEQGQGWVKYRAVLVPKMWQATRAHRSRIFMDKTIEELVTAVLEADGLDPKLDFEFQLSRPGADGDRKTRAVYPEREYIVQYEESDWQFLARWLEHEGVFFYFVNDHGEEKVVFADTESAYAKSMFGSAYPYRPEAAGDGGDSDKFTEEEVRSFRCRQTRLPTKVTVNDYNWRVPSARLHFSEDVLDKGTGLQAEYNDHFKDEAQGKALAKIRREELACRAKVFHGNGSCRAFRPGTTFTLDGHYRSDFNRAYLLVAVHHEAEQMISLESATITGIKYQNTFEAITDDQPWRPERLSDWPAIKGVMHAKIDAEGDGKYAELDEHGRYKLKLPFDEHSADAQPGKASRWVRMAQPYAGPGAGMHFPLLKGTEVLLTHIDGDPDRPVISGAVPNPETESPATGANHTRNAISTASGNTMQVDDDDNAPGFLFADATASYVSDRRRHKGDTAGGANSTGVAPGSGGGGVNREAAAPDAMQPGATPGSGRGMTTGATTKESAWNADISAVWNTFCTGTALTDIATNGKYRDGTSQGLSSWAGSEAEQGGVTSPPDTLNKAGLDGILAYLTQVSTNLRANSSLGAKNFGGNALGKIHNFTGEAYGSRLRAWIGDDLMIKVGDKYTYNDVTRDVSIGTGGYGWTEEHGDTDDHSWHWGEAKSYSKHVGKSDSMSVRDGYSDSRSWTFGNDTGISGTLGVGATLSMHGAARTDNSITLGAFNANSLFVGVQGGLEICVAPKIEIEIGVQTGAIDLTAWNWQMGLNQSKFWMKSDDVKLQKAEVDLNKTAGRLLGTDSVVSQADNKLLGIKNSVTATNNTVAENRAALTQTIAALSDSVTAVTSNNAAAISNLTAAVASNTAALHSTQ